MQQIRIATRTSQLAMWQANFVADQLRQHHPELSVELIDVTTRGDIDQSQPLSQLGGTGVFTREVQRAVLEDRADLAVHSLKDLPTEIIEPDLELTAISARAVHWDSLVLPAGNEAEIDSSDPLLVLKEGARIGTGSLRRQAQLKAARPDIHLAEIRGNLNTRLKKLDEGEYDAIILAAAGLMRLEWEERLSALLTPPLMYPAVGQGALGLECRAADGETQQLLSVLNHRSTQLVTTAERAMLAQLRAGCHAPVGVNGRQVEQELFLEGIVLSPDGSKKVHYQARIELTNEESDEDNLALATQLGQKVAEALLTQGAEELIHAAD